ncbi:MAG: 50S ribosomal protein L11 methyltransferase [Brumimicrobium sp.]
MNYYKVNLDIHPKQPWQEILISALADIEYESFTEYDDKLQAYVQEDNFNLEKLKNIINLYQSEDVSISFSEEIIPTQNWNAKWEEDYQPVIIDKSLLIRAPFHKEDDSFKHTIVIQPQMSFGTGHHQTTYLLCKMILDIQLTNKTVLDVGTGTGVLGILSSILGAKEIFGTDIDDDIVDNAIENCQRNGISNFKIIKGDIESVPKQKFDVIYANINMNVLLRHIKYYSNIIQSGGWLLLSGFFETDVDTLIKEGKQYGFIKDTIKTLENWAVIKLKKH